MGSFCFGGKSRLPRLVSSRAAAGLRPGLSHWHGQYTVRHAGHSCGDCCLTAVTFEATLESGSGPALARSGSRGSRAEALSEQSHSKSAASHGPCWGTHWLRLANPSQPRTLATATPLQEGGEGPGFEWIWSHGPGPGDSQCPGVTPSHCPLAA